MKEIKRSYDDLRSLIDHIKLKEEVVGIVEYGGRTFSDMSIGGDYDLTVILEKPISHNFNGVHFHVGGIPIDCMILSVDDFLTDNPENPFYLAHLDCNILFDRNNTTKSLIDRIKIKWKASDKVTDSERSLFRFTFKHILDKLEHRLHKDVVYSRFFIYSSFDWYLECYARINNLKTGQPKAHLNHIKESDIDLYELINRMYTTHDLDEQFDLLKKCAERIVEPIGGLWKNGELLLHLLPEGKVVGKEEEAMKTLIFE